MLRMSFAQLDRAFEGHRIREEESWRKFRLVAWEIAFKNVKHRRTQNQYFPIGKVESKAPPTQEELDEIWRKYGKLKRN